MVLIFGVVSADDDPNNDNILQSELIDVGTHSGSIGAYDTVDWYKIKIPARSEFKIEAWIVDPEEYENIEIVSCDENGIPNEQIHFFLSSEFQRDNCHFYELEEDYYQYLQVTGYGDYKMKIFKGDEGGLSDWCCFSSSTIGIALILMISASISMVRRRKKSM
jgi:hypothetical protein